jgi:hypothetical protein
MEWLPVAFISASDGSASGAGFAEGVGVGADLEDAEGVGVGCAPDPDVPGVGAGAGSGAGAVGEEVGPGVGVAAFAGADTMTVAAIVIPRAIAAIAPKEVRPLRAGTCIIVSPDAVSRISLGRGKATGVMRVTKVTKHSPFGARRMAPPPGAERPRIVVDQSPVVGALR